VRLVDDEEIVVLIENGDLVREGRLLGEWAENPDVATGAVLSVGSQRETVRGKDVAARHQLGDLLWIMRRESFS